MTTIFILVLVLFYYCLYYIFYFHFFIHLAHFLSILRSLWMHLDNGHHLLLPDLYLFLLLHVLLWSCSSCIPPLSLISSSHFFHADLWALVQELCCKCINWRNPLSTILPSLQLNPLWFSLIIISLFTAKRCFFDEG